MSDTLEKIRNGEASPAGWGVSVMCCETWFDLSSSAPRGECPDCGQPWKAGLSEDERRLEVVRDE